MIVMTRKKHYNTGSITFPRANIDFSLEEKENVFLAQSLSWYLQIFPMTFNTHVFEKEK